MRIHVILLTFGAILNSALCEIPDASRFLGRFRYGVELLQRIFDNDYLSPSSIFFEAFKKSNGLGREQNDTGFTSDLFTAVINSINGNQEEIAAAGVKISVLVAKMISEAFPHPGRTSRKVNDEFNPLHMILSQPQIQKLMKNVQDPHLTEKVMEEVEGSCMRLLICKMSPFVRAMQRSLRFFVYMEGPEIDRERATWAKSKPMDRVFHFLPEMKEFLENGDICDDLHPSCMY